MKDKEITLEFLKELKRAVESAIECVDSDLMVEDKKFCDQELREFGHQLTARLGRFGIIDLDRLTAINHDAFTGWKRINPILQRHAH